MAEKLFWGIRVSFDFTNDPESLDNLIDWLAINCKTACKYHMYSGYDRPDVFTVLLTPDQTIAAVFLSLWSGFIDIEKAVG